MTYSFFPDVNVWVALHSSIHQHHTSAAAWFRSLGPEMGLVFCRHTQLGMFRLLTTESVMGGNPINQKQCWSIYEQWISEGGAILHEEPQGLDAAFALLTSADTPSPKQWADSYLAAFAGVADLILVTFDHALAGRTARALLLK